MSLTLASSLQKTPSYRLSILRRSSAAVKQRRSSGEAVPSGIPSSMPVGASLLTQRIGCQSKPARSRGFGAARDGIFFVTGNHDHFSGASGWAAELAELGFRTLHNERVTVGGEDGFVYAFGKKQ